MIWVKRRAFAATVWLAALRLIWFQTGRKQRDSAVAGCGLRKDQKTQRPQAAHSNGKRTCVFRPSLALRPLPGWVRFCLARLSRKSLKLWGSLCPS
mgnify:CR=1 FL=1